MVRMNHVQEAQRKIELAQIYLSDGAPTTAARCLREAANLLDGFAEEKLRELSAMIEKKGN